jgi:hypothetical protein
MGKLGDVVAPSEDVLLGGVTIRVRALTLKEISFLFKKHTSTISRTIEAFGPLFVSADPAQMMTAALAAIGECSDFVADAIAIAAGEPGQASQAAALPIEMQFRALITILRLTMGTADPNAVIRDFRDAIGPAAAALGTKH